MNKRLQGILLAFTAVIALLGTAAPAHAIDDPAPTSYAQPELQQKIDETLAEFPGGTQISENTISWEGGAVLLTFPVTGAIQTFAVGNCAAGRFCAYSGANYTGAKLTLSTCGGTVYSLAALGTNPRSIANSHSTGIVRAKYNGANVFRLNPNTGRANNSASVNAMSCSPS